MMDFKPVHAVKPATIDVQVDSAMEIAVNAAQDACADFQSLMPERIGAGEDLGEYAHLQSCDRCRALVRDLQYIAEAAAELMRVEEEPRDELWFQIQWAIEQGEA